MPHSVDGHRRPHALTSRRSGIEPCVRRTCRSIAVPRPAPACPVHRTYARIGFPPLPTIAEQDGQLLAPVTP